MIAKINLDGETRFAIVFEKGTDLESVDSMRNGLLRVLEAVDLLSEDAGFTSERYFAHELLAELSPNNNQAISMMNHYFGENFKRYTSEKKQCEIFI